MSEYPADLVPILEAIADRAARLCESQDARIFVVEGDTLRYVAGFGEVPFSMDLFRPLSRGLILGRAVIDRTVVHVDDLAAAGKEFPEGLEYQRRFGHRTTLAVPLVQGEKALGAILLRRSEVRPFNPNHIELVKAFADQAAVAIENLRLSAELKARNAELTEALEQQTATTEILKVISSSPSDIQPVFDAIARSAARLCDASEVVIRRVDGDVLTLVSHLGSVGVIQSALPISPRIVAGRAILERRSIHVHDVLEPHVLAEYPDGGSRLFQGAPFRTLLVVPLLREKTAIGMIAIRRREVRPFSEKQIKLLETFAAQAAIAIENVRLFNETKEALEQQTATADILKVISGSPTDIQPVLDAVAESAARLCGASDVLIRRADGEVLRVAAHFGSVPVVAKDLPISRRSFGGRAFLERRTIHVHDVLDEHAQAEFSDSPSVRAGAPYRTMLAAPLLREDMAIGVIAIRRPELRPFSDQQVKLLETFAAQAAIAIENVRLFNETKEALEQQTATAQILKVISSSPTDVQPVFDAIVKTGVRLFGGLDVILRLVKENQLVVAASTLPADAGHEFSVSLDGRSITSRAVLRREVAQAPDITAAEWDWVDEGVRRNAERRGIRAVLVAPMLRENTAVGAIVVTRATPGLFSEKQVAVLKTFADQAVIAIENVRLFKELQAKNADLAESLDRQTATTEILRVISSSPTDIQPVLDAVAASAARLCAADDVVIRRIEGDKTWIAAHVGSIPVQPDGGLRSVALRTIMGTVAREGRTLHIPDVTDPHEREKYPDSIFAGRGMWGVRTNLIVPLLRENAVIGAIIMRRCEVRPFSDKQIELLETFAAQAVIAIENVRLFKELQARNTEITESLEQQTATAEILRVISSSPTDIQPVFDAILENATRLCDAHLGLLGLYDGETYQTVAQRGANAEFARWLSDRGPFKPASSGGVLTRMIAERRPIHIPDHRESPAYRDRKPHTVAFVELGGARTYLAVPMLKEERVVGGITIYRPEVRPFTQKQIDLVSTFASQAVIAIENVRLFNETKEALEQQTATASVLKLISRTTFELQPVLDTLLRSAAELCDAPHALYFRIDPDGLRPEAWHNVGEDYIAYRKAHPVPLEPTFVMGRMALTRQPVHVHDVLAEPGYVGQQAQKLGEMRTALGVPVLREGKLIGGIGIFRREVRPFTQRQIELVTTFADQAAIAIENVRLFNETKEALEQQTVISEILRVISSSPTDVQPVFDTIVKSGVHLFGGMNVSLRLVKGDHTELVASTVSIQETGGVSPIALDDDRMPTTRAILRREVVQVPDAFAEEWVSPRYKERAKQRGFRAMLTAPMLRENKAIGTINVARATPGLFMDKEVALLQTFASQAVIAIENVRLFKELEARNKDLGESLEQQTATAEILKVISSSPTDTQPVFEAIVRSGARLFGSSYASLRLLRGDQTVLAARASTVNIGDDVLDAPLSSDRFPSTRAILRRQVVQIPDVFTENWVDERIKERAKQYGYRAVVSAPLLRDNEPIGAINVTRPIAGPFTDKQIALLKTFADQAVIAIENVRLFKELEARNAEITEALQQQTATSEILQVISGSPTDVKPVLETVARRAAQLCDANDARVYVVDGDALRYVGGYGDLKGSSLSLPLTRGVVTGRAVIDRSVVHIDDLAAVLDEFPDARGPQQAFGTRTTLAVPLMREIEAFGAILMRRTDVRPFTEKQIELVKTFAHQTAIGIENVRLFREIQEKGRQLEIANKHKSDFLANMSHELRTPLNAIIGFSEALIEKMFGEMNAKQEDYLKDIHSSGRHLLSLINDILDLSKIEAGRMELELSEFSVPAALKNAITLVRERAQTHGIEVKLHVDPKLGDIRADERKFKQIVLNLLSNAVKFTPDRGRVEVDARRNGGSLKVSVKDTGVGIASKDQAALFEEFRQVGRGSTGKREGTGLGLALTRRFVELHGGKIGVESAPGKGATFTFTLPLNTATSGRGRETRSEKRKTRA